MILRLLSASFWLWPVLSNALECEITTNVLPQLTWENFRVRAGRGPEIVVVHEKLLSSNERSRIVSDIGDEAISFNEVLTNANQVLAANEETLANQAALLVVMNKALKERNFKTVYLDYPPKNVPGWIAFAERLYLETFQLQLRGSPSDVVLDRLLILTVGVPLYLRAVDAPVFSYTALEGFPGAVNPASANASASALSDSFQILEEKLRHNRGSLETARSMHRRLQAGEFKHLSDAEIREKVLSRFWRPAQPAVRAWLDSELTGGARTRSASRSDKEGSSKSVAGDAKSLLSLPGKSIFFLHDEKFARLKREFSELCH